MVMQVGSTFDKQGIGSPSNSSRRIISSSNGNASELSLQEYIDSLFGKQTGDVRNPFVDDLRITAANNGEKRIDLRILLSELYSCGLASPVLKDHFREKGIKDFYTLRENLNLRSGLNRDLYELQSSLKSSEEVADWILKEANVKNGIDSTKILNLFLEIVNLKEDTVKKLLNEKPTLTFEDIKELSDSIKKTTGFSLTQGMLDNFLTSLKISTLPLKKNI